MSGEPRTAAGRRLLALMVDDRDPVQDVQAGILAIEAEAAQAQGAAPQALDPDHLVLLEHAFDADARLWLHEGSGMTREQETGAAMVWSWLQQQATPSEPTETGETP